jgi:hypothetical protein
MCKKMACKFSDCLNCFVGVCLWSCRHLYSIRYVHTLVMASSYTVSIYEGYELTRCVLHLRFWYLTGLPDEIWWSVASFTTVKREIVCYIEEKLATLLLWTLPKRCWLLKIIILWEQVIWHSGHHVQQWPILVRCWDILAILHWHGVIHSSRDDIQLDVKCDITIPNYLAGRWLLDYVPWHRGSDAYVHYSLGPSIVPHQSAPFSTRIAMVWRVRAIHCPTQMCLNNLLNRLFLTDFFR